MPVVMQALMRAIRQACSPATWSQGVTLCRAGHVHVQRQTAHEVELRVNAGQGKIAPTVTLYLDDEDWGCECASNADACIHVAAAIIALNQAQRDGTDLPKLTQAQGQVQYNFLRSPHGLRLERVFVYAQKRQRIEVPLTVFLQQENRPYLPVEHDQIIDTLLARNNAPTLNAATLKRILQALTSAPHVFLDNRPIDIGASQSVIRGRLSTRHNGTLMLSIIQDPAISEIFANGAVRWGNILRPIEDPKLPERQLEELRRGRVFGEDNLVALVSDILPALRARIPVDTASVRLPQTANIPPRLVIEANREHDALEVLALLVYGTPPVARVDKGVLRRLGDVIPKRDEAAEQRLVQQLFEHLQLQVGVRHRVQGDAALALAARLHAWGGEITGEGLNDFYLAAPLRPALDLGDAAHRKLHVTFWSESEGHTNDATQHASKQQADLKTVMQAWQNGERLVPLLGGGWAELPSNWLQEHGQRLLFLLDAQKEKESLPNYAAPELAKLCDSLDEEKPADLSELEASLQTFTSIPRSKLPKDLSATLRSYQIEGVSWLTFLRQNKLGAMLADDMGLGKTLQALCIVDRKTLVVAPTSVLSNWESEAKKFRPSLRCNIYHGSDRKLDPKADLTLTTYAILRLDAEQLAQQTWQTVILDEAHMIKNPASQVAQAAFGLNADFRLTLTGTPVENRLDELWSQFHFINPGLLGTRTHFAKTFIKPILDNDRDVSRRLQQRIRPFILRRLKQDVAPELPPRTELVLHCTLNEHERSVYDAVRAATVQQVVEKLEAGGNIMAALEALLRLRQACCHSALVPGQQAGTSSKISVLLEQLQQISAEGHRSLVFSQWTGLLDLIEPHLQSEGLSYLRIDGSSKNRGEIVAQFQADNGPPIMLVSLKAAGTGLTLTAADHVFLMDPWWNPAVEDQAADRAHRIGQTKPVFVHRLVAEQTVEEKILALQQEKRAIAAAVLEGTDRGQSLTRDDLLNLLTS